MKGGGSQPGSSEATTKFSEGVGFLRGKDAFISLNDKQSQVLQTKLLESVQSPVEFSPYKRSYL